MRRALLLGLPLAFLAAACTYDNGDAARILNTPNSCGPAVQATIDADSQLQVDAGQGAGVFIEYSSGGHWQLHTSCDTLKSSAGCKWDVIVTPEDGHALSNVTATDLEATDTLRAFPDNSGSYQLIAATSDDLDGMSFDSDPGAAISVDALLDDVCAVPYFFWVGDGALHKGSPSNPLILVPSAQ